MRAFCMKPSCEYNVFTHAILLCGTENQTVQRKMETSRYFMRCGAEDKTLIDITDCKSLFTIWNTHSLLHRQNRTTKERTGPIKPQMETMKF
jgi:hypothetical protein